MGTENSFPGLLVIALIYNFSLFVLKTANYNFLGMHRLKRIRFNFLVLSN